MTWSFHISLFEDTLHVDKIHMWSKIANITHALPVPVYQQTDFTPIRVVVSRLHAWYRCEISYRSEILAPVQQPRWTHPGVTRPAWHFVAVSCKQIWSHERELERARAGAKVAPVSCKHPLRLVQWKSYSRLRKIESWSCFSRLWWLWTKRPRRFLQIRRW